MLQDGSALFLQDSLGQLDLVIELVILQDIEDCPAASGLIAGSAHYNPVDAGLYEGAGAHLAWLECDIDRASLEPPVADFAVGLADRSDLSMCKGGVVCVAAVVASCDDPAVTDYDGTDRYFTEQHGLLRLPESGAHIFDILR